MRRRGRVPGGDRERGAVAVEFALCIPALVLVVFGGVMLARAIHARTRLSDAVAYAARAEAVAAAQRPNGAVDGASVTQNVQTRMMTVPECAQPIAVQWQAVHVAPYRRLEVTATCTLRLGGVPFLPNNAGLTTVSATAAMPLDVEVN
jgi:Flp pilus assembly protein TadG